MKKLMLLLLALLLTGCATHPLPEVAQSLPPEIEAPLPGAPDTLVSSDTVTLWFRYLDEPLLAPETRAISLSPDQPMEYALLSALLAGPDIQSTSLTGLFPAGTRLLSTVKQGRTLFVTLSREIMNGYPDEPALWQNDPYWAAEMPLRRRLCMQSLIATVTENCDIDAVQVLLEQQGDVTDSLRLRQRYYLDTDDEKQLADPLTRDNGLLLSPGTAMTTVLSLWQQRDWTRLLRYVATDDEDALTNTLDQLPALLDFSLSGPTLAGRTATFTLTARLRVPTGAFIRADRVLKLREENGLWRITPEQLTGWLEGTP